MKSQSSYNYLSIDIDHNLSGERAPLLKRLILDFDICIEKKYFLSSETRKTWSMALIPCHVDYFCSSWYAGISQVLKYKLQVAQNKTVCFIISMPQEQVYLPSLYRIPKLHKCPFKQRYIAGSAKCSTKHRSELLTCILSAIKTGLQSYSDISYSRGGVNQMWILKNSKDMLEYIQYRSLSSCNSINTFDFSTLYTTISHFKLKDKLRELVQLCFIKKRMTNVDTNTLC